MNKYKHIPQGYKDSPLGIIPKEWEVKRLRDIADIGSGGTPSKSHSEYWGGTIPWITTSLLNKPYIDSAEVYITEEGLNNSSAKMLNAGVLLMAMYGQGQTRGKVAKLQISASTNQACAYINVNMGLVDYVHQYLIAHYENIRKVSNDGNQKNLSLGLISNIQILFPPVHEQRLILDILSLWDTAIEKQSELIEKLKLRKRALMQQLLTGKKRLPGFSGEWKEVKLGEIVSFSTQTIETAKIYKERYVGTENMLSDCNGIILYDKDIPYIQVREYKDGDILMSNIRPYLKKIWLSNCDGGCSTDIHVIRNKVNERVNTRFLYYVLMLDTFFEYAMSGAKGSKMPRGDANMLTKYPICYPPITEQLAIINILTDADKEIELAKEKLASLQSQKQGLMQQLLTGKKRIMQL